MKYNRVWHLLGFILVILLIIFMLFAWMTYMPGNNTPDVAQTRSAKLAPLANTLRQHVEHLCRYPNRDAYEDLHIQAAQDYIKTQLSDYGYTVQQQDYTEDGWRFSNLQAILPGTNPNADILVIGAHYDTIPDSPGANDNASGVAVLLELARALRLIGLNAVFILWPLPMRSPPFFQTASMGSLVYAQRLKQQGKKLKGMIALEPWVFTLSRLAVRPIRHP